MATIVSTAMTGNGSRAITITTLGASDTFDYVKGSILYLNNVTGGALTPNLDGADGTNVPVSGIGDVDVSAGYTTPSIGAGVVHAIPLDTVSAYLNGTVTVSGGDGIEASILTF